jgi:hypothetical protein
MAAHDPDVPAPTRIDRGWLMRHPGTLADEARVLIGKPLHRHHFPRPRPIQFRRPSRLVRAPAI